MKKIFLTILILLFQINILKAEVVNNIVIKGNDRVSADTIIVLGDIKKDIDYNDDILNRILSELYTTNFFSDIKLEIVNGTLEISVVENKIIQSVQINGIKIKSIVKILKENINLKDKTPFNEFYAERDLNIIKNSLKTAGYYFVEVKSTLIENDNNTVNLVYDIELGEKAMINKIVFLGNNNFKDSKLRKIIVSEEDKFWKFVSKKRYIMSGGCNENFISPDQVLFK